ncbi:signal transduction histidine kinase, nitrogen specific, NtrB [Candidatus Vecturithrix granuli]|uniref:histidine kinase n=1 Tax=Vecturithrix granuli TaxID=1499967 RepID=A0A081BWL0_VECG1|nr:signal transduction histidine kinase, nitrogen specific, NtrB [Candidatus Vecturithrix granuli]
MKFFRFHETRYGQRRYFPVVAIIAAVATLILLLIVYTSRNLSLARQRLEDSLLQGGLTLIRAIEAGSRTGMRMHWRTNQLQTLVEEIGASPQVVYLHIVGKNGDLLAHTQKSEVQNIQPIEWQRFQENPSVTLTRTIRVNEEHEVFDIAAKITLAGTGSPQGSGHGRMMRPEIAEEYRAFEGLTVIQIGMSMAELRQIQQHDVRNAILMLLILSVVGSAALYFIVVLQNYSAMNYAFHTMQSYAQQVVESMVNGLISLDNQGNIVTMNRQAHYILGLSQAESMEGKTLCEAMTIQDFDLFAALRDGVPVLERQATCTNALGRALPLSLSASQLTDNEGEQLGAVLLFRDLSEVKALEDQVKRSERLASVGKLAAGVAHEIRNPLGALKGFLQYFQHKLALEDQEQTYFTVMTHEVDRLNTVISNLLDFARPKEPVFEPCDLAKLLQHVLALVEGDLQAKQIHTSVDIQAALPQIQVDQDQITQVVLNILLNAIHATESGGTVSLRAEIYADTYVDVTVSDTGKGISPEDLPQIFDPFFSTKKQGTGLGLAIAHTIIEQHGGTITVESTEGTGSTFRIQLPV